MTESHPNMQKRGTWLLDRERIRRLAETMTHKQVAGIIGCAESSVSRILKGKEEARRGRRTKARFAAVPLAGVSATMPPYDNEAIVAGRTLYPATVVPEHQICDHESVFKSGYHAAKIGGEVLKGRWKGFPIYTLTLEERATCPTECDLYRSCYGNRMNRATRFTHGERLEERIVSDVQMLAQQHPDGFVIRLHMLGDFYSVAYVQLWQRLLREHPNLWVFGYTARWDYERDPIARALVTLIAGRWRRFSVRLSNAPVTELSTVTIEVEKQCPPDAIVCPEQTGRTESCSTCGLCWGTRRRIAFIRH